MLSIGVNGLDFPKEYIVSVNLGNQRLIGVLHAEVKNAQILHQMRGKFVSQVQMMRKRSRCTITDRFVNRIGILYGRSIVAHCNRIQFS
ncbi:hypothetical protein A8L34_19425 [Bacillus sp. FJAT-27264]|nr:hypothetical protein A8L34_19425 [Bacillus sp. FJAT-27264]